MCTPYAHPNLLTSPADNKWKAVRKAVAVSFSANNIRKKFPASIINTLANLRVHSEHTEKYAHKRAATRCANKNKNTPHSQILEPGDSSNPPGPH
eukprot:1140115-Pelagomonas_calceolata.AAC.6